MDLGYKRLLGRAIPFRYGPRPDVGVLFRNGAVKAIEIASKTDDLTYLYARNISAIRRLGGVEGSVYVNTWARTMNKFFPILK
jgi:hypothetical protein